MKAIAPPRLASSSDTEATTGGEAAEGDATRLAGPLLTLRAALSLARLLRIAISAI